MNERGWEKREFGSSDSGGSFSGLLLPLSPYTYIMYNVHTYTASIKELSTKYH